MQHHLVITVLGSDRPGLVEALSGWVSRAGGNWLDSHLAHIGDQFAGILEVSVPQEGREALLADLKNLETDSGLRLCVQEAGPADVGGELFEMECVGQDRPGIVRSLTDALLEFRANVEHLSTTYQNAPMSGEHLFVARLRVRLPPGTELEALESRLGAIGEELMLDVQVAESR